MLKMFKNSPEDKYAVFAMKIFNAWIEDDVCTVCTLDNTKTPGGEGACHLVHLIVEKARRNIVTKLVKRYVH